MDWFAKSYEITVGSGGILAKIVEAKIEQLDAGVKDWIGTEKDQQADFDVEEVLEGSWEPSDNLYLRIDDALKQYVRNLVSNQEAFLQHPLAHSKEKFELSSAQEKHAFEILQEVPELSAFRYRVTPSAIQENDFWKVYFDLLAKRSEDAAETKKPLVQEKSVKKERKPKPSKEDLPSDDFVEIKPAYRGALEEDGYYTDFSSLNQNRTLSIVSA